MQPSIFSPSSLPDPLAAAVAATAAPQVASRSRAYRTERGEQVAETVVPLGLNNRELRVETRKSVLRGGVSTQARVVMVSADGRSYSHSMSFGAGGGDFSRTLAHDRTARATEKTIARLHAAATTTLDDLIAEARAHYKITSVE